MIGRKKLLLREETGEKKGGRTWKKKRDKEIGDKRNDREVTGDKKQREKQTGRKRDAGNETTRERNGGKWSINFSPIKIIDHFSLD